MNRVFEAMVTDAAMVAAGVICCLFILAITLSVVM